METIQRNESNETSRSSRGFASMNTERQREIARKGGRAAHAKGTAHEFTADEARAAGQKGGQRVSANREHMSRIGRIGGKKSAGKRQGARDDADAPERAASDRPGQSSESRQATGEPGRSQSESPTAG